MRLAVLQGACVNQADAQGMTPLLLATSNVLWAGATAVEALLHAGADPDQADQAGATPLCVAASLQVEEDYPARVCVCVREKTEQGEIVCEREREESFTCSRRRLVGSMVGRAPQHSMFFPYGNQCRTARTDCNMTWGRLLRCSPQSPQVHHVTDVMHMLLGATSDMNRQTHDGATALYIAAQEGNCLQLRLLLDAGADKELCAHDTT